MGPWELRGEYLSRCSLKPRNPDASNPTVWQTCSFLIRKEWPLNEVSVMAAWDICHFCPLQKINVSICWWPKCLCGTWRTQGMQEQSCLCVCQVAGRQISPWVAESANGPSPSQPWSGRMQNANLARHPRIGGSLDKSRFQRSAQYSTGEKNKWMNTSFEVFERVRGTLPASPLPSRQHSLSWRRLWVSAWLPQLGTVRNSRKIQSHVRKSGTHVRLFKTCHTLNSNWRNIRKDNYFWLWLKNSLLEVTQQLMSLDLKWRQRNPAIFWSSEEDSTYYAPSFRCYFAGFSTLKMKL